MEECRPLGLLIGLPFAVLASVLSLLAAVVYLIGLIINCACPCCCCLTGLADLAMDLIKLPVVVIQRFIDQIPC